MRNINDKGTVKSTYRIIVGRWKKQKKPNWADSIKGGATL